MAGQYILSSQTKAVLRLVAGIKAALEKPSGVKGMELQYQAMCKSDIAPKCLKYKCCVHMADAKVHNQAKAYCDMTHSHKSNHHVHTALIATSADTPRA
ncbi:hypothetical protein XELAEV_18006110mg [Xenopus laevis]|uniref:Uncharacterized protein n=1 Tax=Xenopus laevis TaxID=8355 RepID=A0A974I3W7_XENLA|nr:hypothetical protein XELAEV_18006110mg [Xenopus laevis]